MNTAVDAGGKIVDENGIEYSPDEMVTLADEWDAGAKMHGMFDGQWADGAGRRWTASEFC
jgi:hypothetical protein